MHNRLLLIDGNSILFRVFYASNHDVAQRFIEYIRRIIDKLKPEYVGLMFDISSSHKRKALFPEYKSNRNKIDLNIIKAQSQIDTICNIIKLRIITKYGYEADDIIASYAHYYSKICKDIVIVSTDKDLMNMMYQNIRIFNFIYNRFLNMHDMKEKFHVQSHKLIRIIQSIAGDQSDNIPGAYGIGIKGAAKIASMFHENTSLDEIYNSIGTKITGRLAMLLTKSRESVYLSYQLTRLDCTVEINFDLTDMRFNNPFPSLDYGELLQQN